MKKLTKEQVIELVKSADSLLISTNAGEGIVNGWDECVKFANNLNEYYFYGEADEIPAGISESPYYEPEWPTFRFSSSDTPDGDIYINIGE